MIIRIPNVNPSVVFLIVALILYAANLKEVFNIERFNPIEKSIWLIIAIYFLFSNKVDIKWVYASAFAILLAVILSLLNNSIVFSPAVLFLSLSQIPILFFLTGTTLHKSEFKDFLSAYTFMPLMICCFGVLYEVLGIKEMFKAEYYTGLYRFGGSMIAAYLAGWCLAGIYSCLILLDKYQERFYVFMIALNFFILFLTVARVPLFVAVCLTLFYFFFRFKWMKNKIIVFTYYSLPAAFFALYFLVKNAERIFSGGTSGRDMIWEHLLYEYDFYFSPYGAGFGHQYLLMDEEVVNLTGTIGAHNDYIRLMVELGLLGSIAFWIIFISTITATVLMKKNSNLTDKLEVILAFTLFMIFAYFDNVLAAPAVFSFFVIGMMRFNAK